jgi:hypothetical protein
LFALAAAGGARIIVCRAFVASTHPSTQRAFDALAQIMMMLSPQ